MADNEFLAAALAEARLGYSEGGVPIGAALAIGDELVATGRNRRVQLGSVIRHAEMDCLERAGRLPAEAYAQATLYTTGYPCRMCAGAILHYGIARVVVGTNDEFAPTKALFAERGVIVVVMDRPESLELIDRFSSQHPNVWLEDIGTAAADRDARANRDSIV
jgi:cytosine deaminase